MSDSKPKEPMKGTLVSSTLPSNRRSIHGPALLCLVGLVVSACRVGPDYHKPGTNAQSAWGSDEARSSARLDPQAAPDPKWWKALGDADLERLVRLAVRGNADLEQARQRARKARSLIGAAESRLLPSLGAGGS